jgi:hypothetical protein
LPSNRLVPSEHSVETVPVRVFLLSEAREHQPTGFTFSVAGLPPTAPGESRLKHILDEAQGPVTNVTGFVTQRGKEGQHTMSDDRRKNLISSGMFTVHCAPELVHALGQHVSERGQTRSGFVRQAVVAALQAEGVELPKAAHHGAGYRPTRHDKGRRERGAPPASRTVHHACT